MTKDTTNERPPDSVTSRTDSRVGEVTEFGPLPPGITFERILFPTDLVNRAKGQPRALIVGDDSMHPTLRSGSAILVDWGGPWDHGQIVVATIVGVGLVVRRARRDGTSIALHAANPSWPDLRVPASDVRGRVLAVVQPVEPQYFPNVGESPGPP